MEIKTFDITNQEEAFSFFLYCMRDLKLNFHPDTPFENYRDQDNKPLFLPQEADALNVMLRFSCFAASRQGADVYWLAQLAQHLFSLMNVVRAHDEDNIKPGVTHRELLEQIEGSYFGTLKPTPYLVNWSVRSLWLKGAFSMINSFSVYETHGNETQVRFYVDDIAHGDCFIYTNSSKAFADINELIKFGYKLEQRLQKTPA